MPVYYFDLNFIILKNKQFSINVTHIGNGQNGNVMANYYYQEAMNKLFEMLIHFHQVYAVMETKSDAKMY